MQEEFKAPVEPQAPEVPQVSEIPTDSKKSKSEEWDLEGMNLVEAGAGTGKTYTIQKLLLRLLLEKEVSLPQILVVTFTKAATAELLERLHAILQFTKETLESEEKAETIYTNETYKQIGKILEKQNITIKDNRKKCLDRIQKALQEYDQAAVMTIDGFCQRMLQNNALHSFYRYGAELRTDCSPLQDKITMDFCRKILYANENDPVPDASEELLGEIKFGENWNEEQINSAIALCRKMLKSDEVSALEGLPLDPKTLKKTMNDAISNAWNGAVIKFVDKPELSLKDIEQEIFNQKPKKEKEIDDQKKLVISKKKDISEFLSSKMNAEFWKKDNPLLDDKFKDDKFKLGNNGLLTKGITLLKDNNVDSFSALAEELAKKLRDVSQNEQILNIVLGLSDFGSYICKRGQIKNDLEQLKTRYKSFFDTIDELQRLVTARDEEEKKLKKVQDSADDDIKTCITKCMKSIIRKTYFEFYKSEMENYKAQEGFLTFDDLINRLYEIIVSPQGKELRGIIRKAYPYIFVDEFQDTAPKQFALFRKIFDSGDQKAGCFFMIGDPKQAIYSFRGGDVYAYLEAKSECHQNPPLTYNYRSGKKYIDRLNVFYKNQNNPFKVKRIIFSNIEQNDKGKVEDNLYKGEMADANPLQFIKKRNKPEVKEWTVKKVCDLLSQNRYFIGNDKEKRPVTADDIAILVPTKPFGREIEKELNAVGIDTVWLSDSDIFKESEALIIWRFLEMLYGGAQRNEVMSVLGDGLFMCTATELQNILTKKNKEDISYIDLAREYFQRLMDIWEKKGIYAMFRELLYVTNWQGRRWLCDIQDDGHFGPKATLSMHILQSDKVNGRYIFGRIRQLTEYLHQAVQKWHFTPGGLLSYLRGKIKDDANIDDGDIEFRVQRNTDLPSVRLMTLHASKGLEFPIVLLPNVPVYKYTDTEVPDRLFHDEKQEKRTVDMFDDKNPKATEEFLEEKLRLIYVGLTRAKFACYVPYSTHEGKGVSLDAIKHLSTTLDSFPEVPITEPCDVPPAEKHDVDDEPKDFSRELLPAKKVGSFCTFKGNRHIDVLPNGDMAGTAQQDPPVDDDDDDDDALAAELEIDAKETNLLDAPEQEALSGVPVQETPSGDTKQEALLGDSEQEVIFTFAKGKEAGTIWHEIFEVMALDGLSEDSDFKPEVDMEYWARLPKKEHYYAIQRAKDEDKQKKCRQAFARMLKGILFNPLAAKTEKIILKDISPAQCARELDFLYALKPSLTLENLKKILDEYNIPTGDWAKPKTATSPKNKTAQPPKWSLLTGKIDLICQSKSGKYYVIDWKTNILDSQMENFSFDGVEKACYENLYTLQYLIYTVALWHFIKERTGKELTKKNYEEYFGGVFYLFVRGMAAPLPDMTPKQKEVCQQRGIYYNLPPFDLINDLKNLLDIRSSMAADGEE